MFSKINKMLSKIDKCALCKALFVGLLILFFFLPLIAGFFVVVNEFFGLKSALIVFIATVVAGFTTIAGTSHEQVNKIIAVKKMLGLETKCGLLEFWKYDKISFFVFCLVLLVTCFIPLLNWIPENWIANSNFQQIGTAKELIDYFDGSTIFILVSAIVGYLLGEVFSLLHSRDWQRILDNLIKEKYSNLPDMTSENLNTLVFEDLLSLYGAIIIHGGDKNNLKSSIKTILLNKLGEKQQEVKQQKE